MASLAKYWEDFWFRPVSPAPVCLFRIFFGFLVLAKGLLLAPDLLTWYGSHPIISTQTIHDWEMSETRFSFLFLFPDSDFAVRCVYTMLMTAAASLTLGFRTRLSALIVFLCLCSFDQRMACIMNSGDTLLRLESFLLIFSEAGALYSLDRKFNGSRRPMPASSIICSPWAQRLLQLELSGVYAQAFFSKIAHSEWIDGTAFYNCSRLVDFARFPIPLFNHLWIYQILCWMTLAIELALFTLVWSTTRKHRYLILLIGTFFHLCIDVTMNIPLFEYIMIANYINFLEPADVQAIVQRIRNLSKISSASRAS
jgi:Vitamin K-dependent gamma-carboxylase